MHRGWYKEGLEAGAQQCSMTRSRACAIGADGWQRQAQQLQPQLQPLCASAHSLAEMSTRQVRFAALYEMRTVASSYWWCGRDCCRSEIAAIQAGAERRRRKALSTAAVVGITCCSALQVRSSQLRKVR